MGARGTAGQGLQGVGLWAEAWSCPSQGTQYVWNRTALIQASKDPSVTHLMGNDPTPLSSPGMAAFGPPCTLTCRSLLVPFPTGLFEPADMKYEFQRDHAKDPSLQEMTEVALRVLSRNPRGFYLFVEGEWQPLMSRGRKGAVRADSASCT